MLPCIACSWANAKASEMLNRLTSLGSSESVQTSFTLHPRMNVNTMLKDCCDVLRKVVRPSIPSSHHKSKVRFTTFGLSDSIKAKYYHVACATRLHVFVPVQI